MESLIVKGSAALSDECALPRHRMECVDLPYGATLKKSLWVNAGNISQRCLYILFFFATLHDLFPFSFVHSPDYVLDIGDDKQEKKEDRSSESRGGRMGRGWKPLAGNYCIEK